jgi:AGZA family xanthine/uracil permease-like MFS transporter
MGLLRTSIYARIDQLAGVSAAGSTLGRELRAALTTFLAMAYILFVNPQILGAAIIIPSVTNTAAQLLSATALAAAFGSILMGLLARLPIALAPGMGLNAYFTYTVVLGQGVPWPTALGAVFISGIVFLFLSVSGVREAVVNAIPLSIKRASGAGIGLFLGLIGLQSGGVVIVNPSTMIGLGDLGSPRALLALGGLVVIAALLVRRVPGAILLGICLVSLAAIILRLPVYDGKEFTGFHSGLAAIASWPVWPRDLLGALDLKGALSASLIGVVVTFLFVAFFDTAGTLLGLAETAGFTDAEGRMRRAGQAFSTDALATSVGAVLGTSTTTAYMESAAGIEDGGKTGLVAIFTGLLFLVALFFWPLAAAVPPAATAPALLIVGAMLIEAAGRIDWRDHHESIPAFVTMLAMPFTFSIANGISIGIITHVLISLLGGRWREIHPVMYLLALMLGIRYLWSAGH